MSGAEWAQQHPATQYPGLLRWTTPVRAHGDDASFKSLLSRKLNIVSLHAELSDLNTLLSRLACFVVLDDYLITERTLNHLYAPWPWSWRHALDNTMPSDNHMGGDLPEVRSGPGLHN